MQVRTSLRAAGSSHPGLVRDHNEDRFLSDPDRGLFVVVDGVGGQAAGETAAETALSRLRARLEREAGPVEQRIREAITDANNEVFRLARSRPDWAGMACVLTVVVVEGTHAVVGHVGDTRLYKIRAGRIQKLTRDHSPVGEREDAGELTEAEAMRHPRRNEVYRDVGSEQHRAGDDGFIDTFTVPFEIDSALLICSDGLSDLVNAETMLQRVEAYAGHPYEVTRALIEAANDAGGKDNVTAVYVEGSRFAEGEDTGAVRRSRPVPPAQGTPWVAAEPAPGPAAKGRGRPARLGTIVLLLAGLMAWSAYHAGDFVPSVPAAVVAVTGEATIVVPSGGSISAAIDRAATGTVIVVEPGEYREQLRLKSGVHVRSRVSRGASLRLPETAAEADAAVVASEVQEAEFRGFRIVGDAATPLGTGVQVQQSDLVMIDLEIQGARGSAVIFGAGASGTLLASDLRDNPGIALDIRSGATPRILSNTFTRNATGRSTGTIIAEPGAKPLIEKNVFVGVTAQSVALALGPQGQAVIANNWFVPAPRATPRGGRQGRQ
jgi:serine/threonine protein phosphatase PrpC